MMRTAAAVLLAATLTAPACGPDTLLAALDLTIYPNPAQAGDSVTFAFHLTVVPAQTYSVIVLIDGGEHLRGTRSEAVDGPFVVNVGAAADLISRYGLGTHIGEVEVRLHDENRRVGTAARTFDLQAPAPPLPPPATVPQ